MGGRKPVGEQPQLIEMLNHAPPVARLGDLRLDRGFQEMHVHRGVAALRDAHDGGQETVAAPHRIRGGRANPDAAAGAAVVAFDARFDQRDGLVERRGRQRIVDDDVGRIAARRLDIGVGLVENPQRDRGAHAGQTIRVDDRIDVGLAETLLGKMIDHSGGAGEQMLDASEQRRQPDLVGGPAGRVRLIAPHEGRMAEQVAGALQNVGGRMGVGVDEARHQQPLARLDDLHAGGRCRSGVDHRRDGAVPDDDVRAVGPMFGIGQHQRVLDHQIGHVCALGTMRSLFRATAVPGLGPASP